MTRRIRLFDDRIFLIQEDEPRQCVLIRYGTENELQVEVIDCPSDEFDPYIDGNGSEEGHSIAIDGVFGIYNMLSGPFIALIISSQPQVSGSHLDIRKVTQVAIVPLFAQCRRLDPAQQRDEDRYLELLHMAFSQHKFYFSYTYDLTLTFQRIAKMEAYDKQKPVWQRSNSCYFWNHELVADLIKAQAHEWVTPVMSGYVQVRGLNRAGGKSFSLILISRRSRFRQGCRFTMRGAEESGDVANFVETEQAIIFQEGSQASYVQCRGSIPLSWWSPVSMKYAPNVTIDQDTERNRRFFKRHVEFMLRDQDYEEVLFINLIDKKKQQGALGKAFSDTAEYFTKDQKTSGKTAKYTGVKGSALPIHFLWFDFHKECAKMRWHHLSKIIDMKHEDLDRHKFCRIDSLGKIKSTQNGLVRVNCMDNLDRTNVVQSVLARRFVIHAIAAEGGEVDMSEVSTTVLDSPYKEFELVFKDMWANNADALSLLYSGTPALKTDFTRSGKRTLMGLLEDGLNSCARYYINNILDGKRQDSIDLMLGRYVPSVQKPTPFVPRAGQETLVSLGTKVMVSAISMVAVLIIGGPPDTALTTYVLLAVLLTLFGWSVYLLRMVKQGSRFGKRLVMHPKLCPEPSAHG